MASRPNLRLLRWCGALVVTMGMVTAAATSSGAATLTNPTPGLTYCIDYKLVCGSGGQLLEDTLATDVAAGLPSIADLFLGPAAATLFLTGDSAPTQLVVNGCANVVTANGGFPAFQAYGLLAGAQTSTDCTPVQLLEYGVYSGAKVATEPWQRAFCSGLYANGLLGGLTTVTAWTGWTTGNGFPSGTQSQVDAACPTTWRPFFAGTGGAPAAGPQSAVLADMPHGGAGYSAYCNGILSAAGTVYPMTTVRALEMTCSVNIPGGAPWWLSQANTTPNQYLIQDFTAGGSAKNLSDGVVDGTGSQATVDVFAPGASPGTWRVRFMVPSGWSATDDFGGATPGTHAAYPGGQFGAVWSGSTWSSSCCVAKTLSITASTAMPNVIEFPLSPPSVYPGGGTDPGTLPSTGPAPTVPGAGPESPPATVAGPTTYPTLPATAPGTSTTDDTSWLGHMIGNVITWLGTMLATLLNLIVSTLRWLGSLISHLENALLSALNALQVAVVAAVMLVVTAVNNVVAAVALVAPLIVNALAVLGGLMTSAIAALPTAIATALTALLNAIVTAVNAVAVAVAAVTTAVTALPTAIATAIATQLQTLFVPDSTEVATQVATVKATVAPTALGTATTTITGMVNGIGSAATTGLGGSACGPSLGFDGITSGGISVPGFRVYLPSPSGCTGNGPAGGQTTYDTQGYDLLGYAALLRGLAGFAMAWAFFWSLVRAAPWSSKSATVGPAPT